MYSWSMQSVRRLVCSSRFGRCHEPSYSDRQFLLHTTRIYVLQIFKSMLFEVFRILEKDYVSWFFPKPILVPTSQEIILDSPNGPGSNSVKLLRFGVDRSSPTPVLPLTMSTIWPQSSGGFKEMLEGPMIAWKMFQQTPFHTSYLMRGSFVVLVYFM